jgi:hypothetical protein
MAMTEDLSVFFDAVDFAVPVIRQRTSAADLAFNGIVGTADEEALQGNVMAAQRQVHFASADVVEGDTLVIAAVPARVLRVDRINDGAEMCAYLSSIV